ncbi:MAG: hypothetical protein ACQKBY_07755 [Verrucomicrobiales bacterium]
MTLKPTFSRFVRPSVLAAASLFVLQPAAVFAHGEIGDDIKNMQAHLDEYESDLRATIAKYQGLVDTYSEKGAGAVKSDDLIAFWEDAKMHYPVELNYVQVYAKIWQAIYAIKEGIDAGKPKEEVQASMQTLRENLWQGMGVVKLAAQIQAGKIAAGEAPLPEAVEKAGDPVETLTVILDKLDRIMAKSAERDFEASKEMVHDTYLNLFEGVEGALIELDAKLVADLEKDFNVVLPKLIEDEAPLAEIKKATEASKGKIEKARDLLKKASKETKDAF